MEVIWEDFENKVGDFFKIGHELPLSLHIVAVRTVQEKLDLWKDELGISAECIVIQPEVQADETVKEEVHPPPIGFGTKSRRRASKTPAKYADFETPPGKANKKRGGQVLAASEEQTPVKKKKEDDSKTKKEADTSLSIPDVSTPKRRGRPRRITKTSDKEELNNSHQASDETEQRIDDAQAFISAVLKMDDCEIQDSDDEEEETDEEAPTDLLADLIKIKQESADDIQSAEPEKKRSPRTRKHPDEEGSSDDADENEMEEGMPEYMEEMQDTTEVREDEQQEQENYLDDNSLLKEETEKVDAIPKPKKSKKEKSGNSEQDTSYEKKDNTETPKRKRGRPRRTVYEVGEPVEKNFTCDQCPRKFAHETNLKKHQKLHESGPLECPHCDKVFYSSGGFTSHLRLHTGDALQCPQCPYKSARSAWLENHIRTVHMKDDPSTRPFLCSICGAAFGKSNQLKIHEDVHGPQEKVHQCPHCPHKTHRMDLLRMHLRNVHAPRDLYICNICGAQCKYRQNLIDHQKRHFGEKNVECEQCQKKFINRSVLAKHMLTHKERQYRCDICSKKFATKAHLVRHRVIHTGEKDFGCTHCTYRCNLKNNLKKHLKAVHKLEVEFEGIPRVTRIHEIEQTAEAEHLIADENHLISDGSHVIGQQNHVSKHEVVERFIVKEYPDTASFLNANRVMYTPDDDTINAIQIPQVQGDGANEMVVQTVVSEEIVQSAMQQGQENVETIYLPVSSSEQTLATLQPVSYVYEPARALPSTAWSNAVSEAVENIPKEEDVAYEQIIIYQ